MTRCRWYSAILNSVNGDKLSFAKFICLFLNLSTIDHTAQTHRRIDANERTHSTRLDRSYIELNIDNVGLVRCNPFHPNLNSICPTVGTITYIILRYLINFITIVCMTHSGARKKWNEIGTNFIYIFSVVHFFLFISLCT